MPELPEVETTLRGLIQHLQGQVIQCAVIREFRLRWPIPANLDKLLKNQSVIEMRRRGKYILIHLASGTLIMHLGMSGRLGLVKKETVPGKHDHIDIIFKNSLCLRLTDPRRFGAVLFTAEPDQHPLLAHLGPEPLTPEFNGKYLKMRAAHKKLAVKSFIMDSKMVVGVGNIYATEALFEAGIHPLKPAGEVTLEQYQSLVTAIKNVLKQAIKQGGTTLRDFMQSDGKPGYFQVHLKAYGRQNEPCEQCGAKLKLIKIGQRSTVFCGKCQR